MIFKAVMASIDEMKFIERIDRKVRKTISKHNCFHQATGLLLLRAAERIPTVCLYILKKLGYNVEAVIIDAGIGIILKTI
jgi:hypothetical protein